MIRDAVEALCIEANTTLPADVKAALDEAEASEPWPLAKQTLGLLQQNLCVAAEQEQDTLLNIDGKGPAHAEAVVAKSTRPSVLDHLKRPVPPRSTDKKPKQHEEVR